MILNEINGSAVLNGTKSKVTEEQNVESNWQKGSGGLAWQGNSPEGQFFSVNLERLANRIQLQNPPFQILIWRRFCTMLPRQHNGNWSLGTMSCCLEITLINFPIHDCPRSRPLKHILLSIITHDLYFLYLIQWYGCIVYLVLMKDLYNHY